MGKLPFLSDEWTAEAKRLHEEAPAQAAAPAQALRMNLIVSGSPLSEGDVKAHLDTSAGELVIDLGHLDSPSVTVSVDYETAKAVFVDGNTQAAIQAFMEGKIKVDGDMAGLLALQSTPIDPAHEQIAARIRDMTA